MGAAFAALFIDVIATVAKLSGEILMTLSTVVALALIVWYAWKSKQKVWVFHIGISECIFVKQTRLYPVIVLLFLILGYISSTKGYLASASALDDRKAYIKKMFDILIAGEYLFRIWVKNYDINNS